MIEWLLELKTNIDHHGIRIGLIITLYAIYRKERRNMRLDKRDESVFHNHRIIMDHLGVGDQWRSNGQPSGSINSEVQLLKRQYSLLRTAINRGNPLRRKRIMEKLKSRKLWAMVIGAALVVLNDQMGWGFQQETIYGFVTLVIGYIFGQAHVDAKKAGAADAQRPGDSGAAI